MSESEPFETTAQPSGSIAETLIVPLLAVLVLAIYFQATGFDFIDVDDNLYVYRNPAVLSGLNWESFKWAFYAFHSANWHPITWLSHMLDIQLFGLNPGSHHAVNILLHLLNSILVLGVFRSLTGKFWPSAAVAVLFAVHPAHVESVAWISERKDLLSTFFFLLTLLAYGKCVRDENSTSAKVFGVPKASAYWLGLALFALGLMSKPMLVTVPFVLLLLDYWPFERLRSINDLRALMLEKVPFFLLSAASSVITIMAQRSGGAVQSLDALPFIDRLQNAIIAYVNYIVMMFYPANLALSYPYPDEFSIIQVGASLLILAGITASVIRFGTTQKYLIFGWFFFLGTLVPVIGLIQVGAQSMADRYTYIPFIGLFVIVSFGAAELIELPNKGVALVTFAILAIVTAGFGVLSCSQVSYWKNSETVYRRSLSLDAGNYIAANNLCLLLADAGRTAEADGICSEAQKSGEKFPNIYNTLGILAMKKSNAEEATNYFSQYIERSPNDPLGHFNLATSKLVQAKPEEAETSLERAANLNRNYIAPKAFSDALSDLGRLYAAKGEHKKASEALARLLFLDQSNAEARLRMAASLYAIKDLENARGHISVLEQQQPENQAVLLLSGKVFAESGENESAIQRFEQVIKGDPKNEDALKNLEELRGGKNDNK